MNNIKTRVFWLDAVRAVSMVFVLVNHSLANSLWLQKFYTPFFLTSFFFVSGFVFMQPNQHFSLKNKLLRLTESLIIPYFTYWIVSYFILDVIVMNLSFYDFLKHLMWSFQDGNKLWFISCLLIIEFMMSFMFALSNKIQVHIIISAMILGCYFCFSIFHQEHSKWSLNVALFMQAFFMFGHIYRIYEAKVNNLCSVYCIPYISIILYFILYIYELLFGKGISSVAANRYSSYWIFILMAVTGIIVLVAVLKKSKGNYILSYIGTNSLLIYFFHKQLLDLSNNILTILNIPASLWGIGILQVLFVLVTITIPVYICNHYIRFMSGKSRWLSNKILSK